MKKKFVLRNPEIKARCCKFVFDLPLDKYEVLIRPADIRSLEQNDKLHTMLNDISKQVDWYGKKLSVLIWKRLCVAAYLREIKESPMMIPAIDGNGIDMIYEHTSKMSKKMLSELIEWVYAFGTEKGIKWHDQERRRSCRYRSV